VQWLLVQFGAFISCFSASQYSYHSFGAIATHISMFYSNYSMCFLELNGRIKYILINCPQKEWCKEAVFNDSAQTIH
jgi:hypothetical protein